MRENKLEEIAMSFFEMDLLDRSAARLLLDMVDGEPPALADIEDINNALSDVPVFVGGRGCLGPQPLTAINHGPMNRPGRLRHFNEVRRYQMPAADGMR